MLYIARDKRRPCAPCEPGLYLVFSGEPTNTESAGWIARRGSLVEMLQPEEYKAYYPTGPALQPGDGPVVFDLLVRKAG